MLSHQLFADVGVRRRNEHQFDDKFIGILLNIFYLRQKLFSMSQFFEMSAIVFVPHAIFRLNT